MTFQKGQPKIGGRKSGSVNKVTASVKDAFGDAFEMLGGAEALFKWAQRNQTDFYKLASKLIPADINMAIKETPQARVFPMGITEDEHNRLSTPSETVDCIH